MENPFQGGYVSPPSLPLPRSIICAICVVYVCVDYDTGNLMKRRWWEKKESFNDAIYRRKREQPASGSSEWWKMLGY